MHVCVSRKLEDITPKKKKKHLHALAHTCTISPPYIPVTQTHTTDFMQSPPTYMLNLSELSDVSFRGTAAQGWWLNTHYDFFFLLSLTTMKKLVKYTEIDSSAHMGIQFKICSHIFVQINVST